MTIYTLPNPILVQKLLDGLVFPAISVFFKHFPSFLYFEIIFLHIMVLLALLIIFGNDFLGICTFILVFFNFPGKFYPF